MYRSQVSVIFPKNCWAGSSTDINRHSVRDALLVYLYNMFCVNFETLAAFPD
jgi:hypothetical protein